VPAPRLLKVAHEISLAHRGACWCRRVEGLVVLAIWSFQVIGARPGRGSGHQD